MYKRQEDKKEPVTLWRPVLSSKVGMGFQRRWGKGHPGAAATDHQNMCHTTNVAEEDPLWA